MTHPFCKRVGPPFPRLLVVLAAVLVTAAVPAVPPTEADAIRTPQPGVPRGTIHEGRFTTSTIFPGTERDYAVYVPAQYEAGTPARLMVFQDGSNYAKRDGSFRVPVLLDNLIHRGELPVTVAVFVNPGVIPPERPGAKARSNRSLEYDSLGDRYVRFLVEEFLPVATKGLTISDQPADRAIGGISSGGICAFTAAWERPDQFGRVLSHIGSFTNIRGGWAYPGLIRQTKNDPKPIRICLQEGRDDLDNLFGSWPLGNEDVAAALQFAGYHHRLTWTEGGHNAKAAGLRLADDLRWLWSDEPVATRPPVATTEPDWQPHPLAMPRDDVPHGRVEQMPPWKSAIFPGTVRDWAIYVPAQYTADRPAALMVFQDGHSYHKPDGQWRVPVVFDNLIAAGAMPPTIAVFLNPGHATDKPKPNSPWKSSNRGFEYDSLGDRYSRFLLEEILPEVEKRYVISPDPEMRAICGASSGGICSFTVAWERPDAFGKVLSTIGSFTNLRGGNVYPSLIRQTEPKPLRIYLADSSGDLDNPFGSWPIANRLLAAALRSMGYDLRFDWAEGYGHNAQHASALFPDALTWLWRSEQAAPEVDLSDNLRGDMTLLKLLIPGEDWQPLVTGLGFADGLCSDVSGNLFFCDMKEPAVYRIAAADVEAGRDTRSIVARESVSGLEFGPDGMLYACQGPKQRVIRIDPATSVVTEVAKGLAPNDLAVSGDGLLYITETKAGQVTRIDPATGAALRVGSDIIAPNGIAFSPDGGTLAVSEYRGQHAWMFRLKADGSLDANLPAMTLWRPIDPKGEFSFNQPPPYQTASRGDGMAVDRAGRFFITSALGVQVFDPTGRHSGLLPPPRRDGPAKPLTSCMLAGPEHDILVVTNGDRIYRRRLRMRGD